MIFRFFRSHMFKVVALICLSLFIYLLIKVDTRHVWVLITKISPANILALVLLRLLFFFVRTLNWNMVLTKINTTERPVSVLRLYTSYLAGFAFGYLTPAGRLGGDGFRASFVRGGRRSEILASVVIEKTLEYTSTLFLMSLGVLLALSTISMPVQQEFLVIGMILFIGILIAMFLRKQKQGLFTWIVDGITRLRLNIPALKDKQESLQAADTSIKRFYALRRKTAGAVFGIGLLLFCLWTIEIHLTLAFIGTPDLNYTQSFLLVVMGNFANLVPGLPGGLGVYEITYVSLFGLLGISLEYGLALIILRRILGFGLAGIGIFAMAARKT